MALAGSLKTMPLTDLLQWIGTSRRSGTLHVEQGQRFKRIVFENGLIVSCSTEEPAERLGHFLLSAGRITEETLRAALEQQESSAEHLGLILVKMGAISPDELTRHLKTKAEETIFSLFDRDDAEFRFDEKVEPGAHAFPVDLRVDDVLLRGLKRYDEAQRIRQVFHDAGIVVRRTGKQPPPGLAHNRAARRIWDSIDGRRTIAEILLDVHGSEFLVTRFLFELHRNGLVEIVEVRPLPADPSAAMPQSNPQPADVAGPLSLAAAPLPVARGGAGSATTSGSATAAAVAAPPRSALDTARDLLRTGEFEAALEVLGGLYRDNPQDDSLRRLVAEAEAAFVERAQRHFVPLGKIPVLQKPIDAVAGDPLSPLEYFLLSRIDGTWDVKSIIQISPVREFEALRVLKRLREKGVIRLEDPA